MGHDSTTGDRRDLVREEQHAFWAWATVEMLRATGIRIKELTELSHHILVQYRLPTIGELVPPMQVSLTGAEDKLAQINCRTTNNRASVVLGMPTFGQALRRATTGSVGGLGK